MQDFLPYGETSVGNYHLLIVQKERGVYRVYVSVDGRWFGHCETVEYAGDLEDVIDAVSASFDPRLFEVHPVTPFSKEEVLATAPHAFEAR